jgi:N-dimethylarginine dimethylaminohydrolase
VISDLETTYGVASNVARLRRVLVRTPATTGDFAGAGWREPDPQLLLRQHAAFCELLAGLGCDVVTAPAVEGLVDACYMYDSAFTIGDGAIVLRSAKPARQDEWAPAAEALEAAGVPIVGRLEGDATADGGDLLFLDARTLVAGRGYRTNAAAHRQIDALLASRGVALERVDLTHDLGPAHVLHTMSFISPVADDLAVVFEPLMPVPLVELLAERGIRTVPVDRDEYLTMACNVLPVRPGVVVVVDGNPKARRAMEAAGAEVHAYDGSEISLKGDGGPTCLTRPIWRRD